MENLELNRKVVMDNFKMPKHGKYWYRLFKHIRDSGIDTWDAQWQYTVSINNGACITPFVNLIENTGFDSEATHTITKDKSLNTKTGNINSIVHPFKIEINDKLDIQEMNQRIPSLFKKILKKLKKYGK